MPVFNTLFFTLIRLSQLTTLIPPLGMLAYFLHGYLSANTLTPTSILLLFITVVLASVWCLWTLFSYTSARSNTLFIALVDLGFFGTLIAGVYELRGAAGADCGSWANSGNGFYVSLGVFGAWGASWGSSWASDPGKTCSMLKACFAFGIMNIVFFFFSAIFAWHRYRSHERDRVVTEERVVRRHRSSGRSEGGRSRYSDGRSNRPYV